MAEVLEGFICPICKIDLKSPEQLTSHFDSVHTDQLVFKSLKDIFGKAKKKILNIDEYDLKQTFDKTLKILPENKMEFLEYQAIGLITSHSDYYKSVRSAKQDKYAAETNKLLIRLDKLVSNMPQDQNLRKSYEQDIVPWLDGSSVKWCPSCAKAFNLTRRQHHCRLCGSILCNSCSHFFDLNIARCMIDPSLNINDLQSNEDISKNGLRLCEHCYKLIELRKQLLDSRNSKTVLVTGYEQMRSLMEQTYPAIAMYSKMVTSLKNGETVYHLFDISTLKSKIARYAEGIDSLSKQIASLQIAHPGSQTNTLQKAIRQAATYFIKEEVVSLPPVPTEAEIAEIRRKNSENTEKRIELERRQMSLNFNKHTLEDQKYPNTSLTQEGWTVMYNSGGQTSTGVTEDDPLVEQINRLQLFIKQARDEMRFEEVAILEKNLKELQEEYGKMKTNEKHQ